MLRRLQLIIDNDGEDVCLTLRDFAENLNFFIQDVVVYYNKDQNKIWERGGGLPVIRNKFNHNSAKEHIFQKYFIEEVSSITQ